MAAAFGAAAPLDYVDYGVTITGDTNVAYARFKSADGAAEAVRLLASAGQAFNGQAVHLEVLYELTLTLTLTPTPTPTLTLTLTLTLFGVLEALPALPLALAHSP